MDTHTREDTDNHHSDTIQNNNEGFDMYTQSHSSLTASSTHSKVESIVVSNQKLLVWIQRQLEFYTALSILPPLSCVDDLGHGKLLLCLIHRFAPGSLPSLVTLLEQKTSIECLLLADDLAQQLWNTAIDSLATYLYHHHPLHENTSTIGDYVDQLCVPSLISSSSSSSANLDEENHVHLPAAINADTLPIWQPLTNSNGTSIGGNDDDDDDTTTTSTTTTTSFSLTARDWIATTHQSVHHYTHQPHTVRLSALVSLLQQLQHVFVGFTRLTSLDGDELIQSTKHLQLQLGTTGDSLTSLTTTTTTSDHSYLVDVLVQRHRCLTNWVATALGLFKQSMRVQAWVTEQRGCLGQVDHQAWLDAVLLYRQENTDVLALINHSNNNNNDATSKGASSPSFDTPLASPPTDWVAHVTLDTVVKTLDDLDGLLSSSQHLTRQRNWQRSLDAWQALHTSSLAQLMGMLDAVRGLTRHASTFQVSCTTLWQQWKILSKRVADFSDGSYAAVLCMYNRLHLISPASSSVEADHKLFAQRWHHLQAALETARQAIHRKDRVDDFIQQCSVVEIESAQLVGQLGGGSSLAQRSWMEQRVQDLDRRLSHLTVLASSILIDGSYALDDEDDDGDSGALCGLIHGWRDTLDRCKLSNHQALDAFRLKCAEVDHQRALASIKQQITMQLDILRSSLLFDPWTVRLDEQTRLEQDSSSCHRYFGELMLRFDQCVLKDNGSSALQEVRSLLDQGKQVLGQVDDRLGVLHGRADWEHKWGLASTWVKTMLNRLHRLGVDKNSARTASASRQSWNKEVDGDIGLIRSQIWEYKHNFDQVRQACDTLVVMDTGEASERAASSVGRIRQRQHFLDAQVTELYRLWSTTSSSLSQSKLVHKYLAWVDDIKQSSQSLGARLDDGLRSTQGIATDSSTTIDEADQDMQALESSLVHLWQKSGSQILYPLSFLVVDDGVRWQVLNVYGDLLACLVRMAHELDAWGKRSVWEHQWQHDMDVLQQGRHSINAWLQQQRQQIITDGVADGAALKAALTTIHDYSDDPLHHLQQLFATTQQQYPVHIKMPFVLEEQQQQLTVDTFGHVKVLSNLVTYLQTAKDLKDVCDGMHARLDNTMASEDDIQQWREEAKVSVDERLFASLREQQGQLLAGVVGPSLDDLSGPTMIQGVFGKAQDRVEALHQRFSSAHKASHHSRLMRAHEESNVALTTSLQSLRNALAAATDYKISHASPSAYQAHEQALGALWKDAKQKLDTIHSESHNDVRCLCQLIQLQQEEPEVAASQAALDALWLSVQQDIQGVQHLVDDLGQWRDLSASLDKVEDAFLVPMDTIEARLKVYQETHTTLETVNAMAPSSGTTAAEQHNKAVFVARSGELAKKVDEILAEGLTCAQQEAQLQQAVVSKRLADFTTMDLFANDGQDTLLAQQWDDLAAQMASSRSKAVLLSDTMDALKDLCKEGANAALVGLCQQSVDDLSSLVAVEQHCSRSLLATDLACGRQATALVSRLDELCKELDQFVHQQISCQDDDSSSSDWRLDLHVWEYRVAAFEKNESDRFFVAVQDWLVDVDQDMKHSASGDQVAAVGQRVEQDIQSLVQEVESRSQKIQAQLAEAVLEVTRTRLGKEAEQQWQRLTALVDGSDKRADALMADFYPHEDADASDDNDDSMVQTMGQEQDLVMAEQTLLMLEHEMRPLIKTAVMDLKNNLDGLATSSSASTVTMNHTDVDETLAKWESKIQQHKQHLRHGITMCQYYAAVGEVHGYMYAMEQMIDKNNPELMVATRFMMVDGHATAVELETKHKIYSGALDISMEKVRQAAASVVAAVTESSGTTDYAHLVVKRTKLEQRFNDRMKEWRQWIGSTSSSGSSSSSSSSTSTSPRLSANLRSRKISLPSKMPSPPMTSSTATSTTATVSSRRRVASSISSSSSPLLQAQRKNTGRKSSFTNATRPPPAPNSYVADPKNDLDMEIGRIVNKAPYKVELQMVPGEAGRYRFGDKVVYCRILKSHMVMVRVGGGECFFILI